MSWLLFLESVPALKESIWRAGIALASNLGGMTSPISSPQNIFAIQEMGRGGNSVSWLSWFAVALPIAFLGNLICWGALLAVYRPNKTLKEVRRLPDTTVSPSFETLPPCSSQTLSCLVVIERGSKEIPRTANLHPMCLCFACSLTDSRHLDSVQSEAARSDSLVRATF